MVVRYETSDSLNPVNEIRAVKPGMVLAALNGTRSLNPVNEIRAVKPNANGTLFTIGVLIPLMKSGQ